MKFFSGKPALIISTLALPLLLGCGAEDKPVQNVTIANPASEHCLKKGGKLKIVREESGQKGMCHLPDGSIVEEWELFRRDNPKK